MCEAPDAAGVVVISGATAAVCGAHAGVAAAAPLEVADLLFAALPTTPHSGPTLTDSRRLIGSAPFGNA
jgi:hypothetical protein